jgi:hypothetical protein
MQTGTWRNKRAKSSETHRGPERAISDRLASRTALDSEEGVLVRDAQNGLPALTSCGTSTTSTVTFPEGILLRELERCSALAIEILNYQSLRVCHRGNVILHDVIHDSL